jgi:hypothetical protein
MNDDYKIKNFVCDNKELLISVIRFLLNNLTIKLPFYKLIVNNIIIPALEEYLKNICLEKK